jgi:deoxyribonuclease-4
VGVTPLTGGRPAGIPAGMQLGAHQSIAGGLEQSVALARADGCEAVQIFTRNQAQWVSTPLDDAAAARFHDAVRGWGVPASHLLAHGSYLVNLAATDAALRRRSLAALVEELGRCARLGVRYLVMHPGAHMGLGEARGLALVAQGMSEALAAVPGGVEGAPWLLIETTAGQGTCLGHRFEHVRDLLAAVTPGDRVGVCVDTCHVHAAGYDLETDEGYDRTFAEMDRVFGLDRVRAFHLNDCKRPRGSRVDRHERIGEGTIGRGAFRRLMNDPRFATLPGVLELPPPCRDLVTRLRRLADGTATRRTRPASTR